MVGKLTPDGQLSASRIPVLLNASPYSTPNELLQEMIDIDNGGEKQHLPQNDAMFWGDTLEPVILGETCKRLLLFDADIDINVPFQHKDLPLAASLDGKATGTGLLKADPERNIYMPQGGTIEASGKVGLLEAKVTSSMPSERPLWSRGPLQLQAQLMCYPEAAWGCVATLYQGTALYLYLYRPDPVVQMQIRDAIIDFERRRKERDYYPPYSPGDAGIVYSSVSPQDPPVEIDPDADADAQIALEQLVLAQRNKAAAEEDINDATTTLMEHIGNAPGAYGLVGNSKYFIKWPSRTYKAQPERVVPAKPERTMRSKTLTIKEID
jgi:hypothetical protein